MLTYDIEKWGIMTPKSVSRNLSPAVLTELAVKNEGARLMNTGALCLLDGDRTGRSPADRFIVEEECSVNDIDWNKENKKVSKELFNHVLAKATAYLSNKDIYVFDGFAGADPKHRLNVRVINEFASGNLFMNNMLIRPTEKDLENFQTEFTVICAPDLKLSPEVDGTRSDAFIAVSFEKKLVLVVGSRYCGEMKKSIFSVMNYLMPKAGVLGMHCSANMATDGSNDTALFFGLSGTGKTTLSADPNRGLIGDDEHGWSADGIFNYEGGCYAKCIDLTLEKEPDIYRAIRTGAVVENVVIDDATRAPDYADDSLTENTRVSYPVEFIDNAVIPGVGGHPKTVIFLTADAFGVLPPVAKLTKEQAMYYFVSGYTSKLAGTEVGVTEPQTTFSTCFGAPFLPLNSAVYAEMLGKLIEEHGSDVYLVNTGWSGGKYGVGKRMSLKITRSIITASLNGELAKVEYETEPFFGLNIPKSCPNVESSVLNPRETWADKKEYDKVAKGLAAKFEENFKKYDKMPAAIVNAGPKA